MVYKKAEQLYDEKNYLLCAEFLYDKTFVGKFVLWLLIVVSYLLSGLALYLLSTQNIASPIILMLVVAVAFFVGVVVAAVATVVAVVAGAVVAFFVGVVAVVFAAVAAVFVVVAEYDFFEKTYCKTVLHIIKKGD